MAVGQFMHITIIVHFISNLTSSLTWQQVLVRSLKFGDPCFRCIISFFHQVDYTVSPFYHWGNQGLEWVTKLPRHIAANSLFQGFSASELLILWARKFFVVGRGCPPHCSVFIGSHGLSSWAASSTLPSTWDNEKRFQILTQVPWQKSPNRGLKERDTDMKAGEALRY